MDYSPWGHKQSMGSITVRDSDNGEANRSGDIAIEKIVVILTDL